MQVVPHRLSISLRRNNDANFPNNMSNTFFSVFDRELLLQVEYCCMRCCAVLSSWWCSARGRGSEAWHVSAVFELASALSPPHSTPATTEPNQGSHPETLFARLENRGKPWALMPRTSLRGAFLGRLGVTINVLIVCKVIFLSSHLLLIRCHHPPHTSPWPWWHVST